MCSLRSGSNFRPPSRYPPLSLSRLRGRVREGARLRNTSNTLQTDRWIPVFTEMTKKRMRKKAALLPGYRQAINAQAGAVDAETAVEVAGGGEGFEHISQIARYR